MQTYKVSVTLLTKGARRAEHFISWHVTRVGTSHTKPFLGGFFTDLREFFEVLGTSGLRQQPPECVLSGTDSFELTWTGEIIRSALLELAVPMSDYDRTLNWIYHLDQKEAGDICMCVECRPVMNQTMDSLVEMLTYGAETSNTLVEFRLKYDELLRSGFDFKYPPDEILKNFKEFLLYNLKPFEKKD